MSVTKKNSKCKESICEVNFNNNVDLTKSLIWSLEKRIGEDLNTLETSLSSGLSSSDITLDAKDIQSSNLWHVNTPNIPPFDISTD
jgi:hypothetical protein